MEQHVDQTALRFNQASIIALGLLGFVLGTPLGRWLVLFTALVLAVGTVLPAAGLFKQFYARALKPLGVLRPRIVPDEPRAHRFAQGIGATVLLLASGALFVEWSALGWALVWLVIALAAINLLFGFCAGCFVYYQLSRAGLGSSSAK